MMCCGTPPGGAALCWRTVLLVLVACVGGALAGFEQMCGGDITSVSPRGICGKRLSVTLSFLCKSYNGKRSAGMPTSTSAHSFPGSRWRRDATDDLTEQDDIFVPRQNALTMLNKRGRGNRYHGIVCECCINQCQLGELMQYCSASSKKRSTWVARQLVTSARDTDHSADQIVNTIAKEERDRVLKQRIGQEIMKNPDNWWTMAAVHYHIRDAEENQLKRSNDAAQMDAESHWMDAASSKVKQNQDLHKGDFLQEKLIETLLDEQ